MTYNIYKYTDALTSAFKILIINLILLMYILKFVKIKINSV